MNAFEIAVTGAGIVAGTIASVAGFGIGSVLTPLLALELGTTLAVAAVSIPHVAATAGSSGTKGESGQPRFWPSTWTRRHSWRRRRPWDW